MDKQLVILITAFSVIIIAFFIFVIFWFFPQVYYNPEGNCETIITNQGDNKIDFVFFTDNVEKIKVKEYVDFFLDSEPFINHKSKFNFYYAGEHDCIIKDSYLFCYSRELIKKSSLCPNDNIIVLSKQEPSIRSSSYMNVISLNINHDKKVILHEFAHNFAKIADEYIPSIIPSGAKNCVKKCDDFEEYSIDECYSGCSKTDYYRSSENSVMRTLKTPDYKKLNTLLIEKNLNKYE